MQASTDDLLEQWHQLREASIPVPTTLEEAVKFANIKDEISSQVHALQISKLQNDPKAEAFWTQTFRNSYEKFSKEYVYRILRSDRQT